MVLFAPEGDLDAATTDLEILLEVGLNVVAILPELAYPPDDDDDDLAVSIDTLAREAEVTALALDPSDALLGTLPLSLTGICSRVDRIVVRRRGAIGQLGRLSLGDWARALATALGWALDDLDEIEEDQAAGGGPSPDRRERRWARGAGRRGARRSAGGGSTLEVEIEGDAVAADDAHRRRERRGCAGDARRQRDPGRADQRSRPLHARRTCRRSTAGPRSGLMPADEDEFEDDD